jgi:hypothetical protein
VEQSVAEHKKAIADLGAKFERLIENDAEAQLWDEFQNQWQHYLAGHDALTATRH